MKLFEDNKIRCGVAFFNYDNLRKVLRFLPKKDPYLETCEWHDGASEKDSWASKNMSIEEQQDKFEQLLAEQDEARGVKHVTFLRSLYVGITRKFGWLFMDGVKK